MLDDANANGAGGEREGRGGRAEVDDPSSVPKVVPFQIVLKGPKQTAKRRKEKREGRTTTTSATLPGRRNSLAVELVTRHTATPDNILGSNIELELELFYKAPYGESEINLE